MKFIVGESSGWLHMLVWLGLFGLIASFHGIILGYSRQIFALARAGLEDHFCGKLLGMPMGCDVCYPNHAEADQDDMDTLLTLLGVAGINFIMVILGADDIMRNYQSTSFHDALYVREILKLRRAPEFEDWLERMGITDMHGHLQRLSESQALLAHARKLIEVV